jgi:glycosyltransferase involved in cell wall biosynthesis
MKDITVVLPALNPDERMPALVGALLSAGFGRVVVVNDGSHPSRLPYFEQAAAHPGCIVLRHETNRGKGHALKTAFAYILFQPDPCLGVVTADADSQHHIDDIQALARALLQDDDALILGVRDFSLPGVPPKSRIGNRLTSLALAAACGLHISDTQTGLRAIAVRYLPALCRLKGERFDFETNMLLAMSEKGIPVREVTIQTIYIDDNRASHYRAIVDSLRILRLIARFAASSIGCAALDIGLYWLIWELLSATPTARRVFLATAIARLVSSVCNYLFNRTAVFHSHAGPARTLGRYYALCAAQMLASWGLVTLLVSLLGGGALPVKILVDILLFAAGFRLQRDWVFGGDGRPV